ncbi:hypothetical protein [Chitinophaga nivalis]|uniref:Hemocyanin middle domain-containing protein n=1 Tax=Chitinophaga nivalis TaxID=2991709 RepID=A0ABT3IWD2_9BACT|nr:hypothetical protein [Chitinophaga nivalis]MCW3462059.1 hypothetical protein [Chitinophaga nivalis]MCW3488249.1 hypothetical protein [Chitinophaga nivalis]
MRTGKVSFNEALVLLTEKEQKSIYGGIGINVDLDRQGETLYYMHQQLNVRYGLERLSNDLDTSDFSFIDDININLHPNI